MYEDDPYSVLDDKIRLNTFKNHPIRYSIAGTVKDIYAITKNNLMIVIILFIILPICFNHYW